MTRPAHFSMIRGFALADFFTLGNAACGVAAVLMAMRSFVGRDPGDLLIAAAFAPAALVFDVLDGRIARWRQTASALGRELDSLADVISFGVSRLARYNVTAESLSGESGKVKYFEGTPIPTSVILTAVLAWAIWQGRIGAALYGGAWTVLGASLHPLALLFALSGTLMISKTLH